MRTAAKRAFPVKARSAARQLTPICICVCFRTAVFEVTSVADDARFHKWHNAVEVLAWITRADVAHVQLSTFVETLAGAGTGL